MDLTLNGTHNASAAPSASQPVSACQDDGLVDEKASKRQKLDGVEPIIPASVTLLPNSDLSAHAKAAWEHFRKLGSPKFHVAPMVDQSELPFRLLCRKYGAEAAYTPMLHSRLFSEEPKYRKEFTTCPEDRPLFVQFCANDPGTLLAAAKIVAPVCDYVDLNLGCPQRIARRGNYGAFLMDNLPLVKSLVENLSSNLPTPVSCKIRIFPSLEDTIAYARMLEGAGCSLLGVHGRTREQKNGKEIRADWSAIQAVKQAVLIPVIANGNVRWREDAEECMRVTGVDGVMSAESLLANPALFAGIRMPGEEPPPCQELLSESLAASCRRKLEARVDADKTNAGIRLEAEINSEVVEGLVCESARDGWSGDASVQIEEGSDTLRCLGTGTAKEGPDELALMLEYLDLCDQYPVPMRMVRAHVHRQLGSWFRVHTEIRQKLNKETKITTDFLRGLVREIAQRNRKNPNLQAMRTFSQNPIPATPTDDTDGRMALAANGQLCTGDGVDAKRADIESHEVEHCSSIA